MNQNELIHELGALLVQDPGVAKGNWQHLVLVSQVEDDTPDMSGFCYDAQGASIAAAPKNFEVLDRLEALRDAMAEADGKGPWQACLIRIDRPTGKITVEFEYDNPTKWAITPANYQQRAQELRAAA